MSAENDVALAEFNAKNNGALNTLVNKHKVKVRKFSDEVMNAIGKRAGEVVAEAGASDALTGKVYDSFLKFRKNAIGWSKLSDQAYWDARLLPFKYGK
jgi:TRAP-type mannitol/chloroaromatic compound transport system substrate-binding protein